MDVRNGLSVPHEAKRQKSLQTDLASNEVGAERGMIMYYGIGGTIVIVLVVLFLLGRI
jgi:hypothetical protein